MPLKNENHFVCDLKKADGTPDCNVDFHYNPGGPNMPAPAWEPGVQAALSKVLAITYPLTGYTTFFCCDDHAIEAIKRGQHLPALPPKVAPATEADMAAAKRGMKVVDGMKAGAKPS